VEETREDNRSGLSDLGLLVNPFAPPADDSTDPLGTRLSISSAALRLLSAYEVATSDPDHKPIVLVKSPEIPGYYNIAAMAAVFSAVAAGDPVPGILQAYVPIDMMRLGRVRAPLSIIAERLSGPGVELTIAAWSRHALEQADTELPEFAAIDADVATLITELDADPAAFTARVFGEPVDRREGAEDTEMLMRIASTRTGRLDADPAEEDGPVEPGTVALAEDATDDPMRDAFVTSLTDADFVDPDNPVDPEVVDVLDPQEILDTAIASYVYAFTAAHLSPVVARGIRAYAAQGTDAMAQELKVSKAPSKTLAALLEFAEVRMRLGVLLYDNFDIWPSVPADLRLKIVATFSQLRWALKDVGVLVFMLTPGAAPEVEEAFASGRKVSWDFEELFRISDEGCVFDAPAAATWLTSAMRDGSMPEWGEALIAAVPDDAELVSACEALAAAIDAAAEAGSVPDPAAVASADFARVEPAPA